jgi:hypothetical protein
MEHSIRSQNTTPSYSAKGSSRHSNDSYDSQSTAPTSIYDSPRPSPRPSLKHAATTAPRSCFVTYDTCVSHSANFQARSSTSTYASTVPSVEDLYDEPEQYDDDQYAIPEYRQEIADSEIRATTPQDFAKFFPSQRRLYIRHDDTTEDGNMNLRVDTEAMEGRHKAHVQLFHLRMHDLKARQFSLRRYARDSGREICHSTRRYKQPAAQRPGIQRSMTNALASLRKADMKRINSGSSVKHAPKRSDSGYGSNSDDEADDVASFMSSESNPSLPIPTNTTKLEFSNYAQVDVKRRGGKSHKRYQFEYWGSTYAWKRVVNKDHHGKSISYHLIKDDSGPAIAHIVPELRSPSEVRAELAAGGWVPPCSMWISDEKALSPDVAE